MIGCYWLLLVKKKSNFSDEFKFKLETTYHQWFFVKVLRKCCGHITSLNIIINIMFGEITKEIQATML